MKRRSRAICPSTLIFDIIEADIELGIDCDIFFIYGNQKHRAGYYDDQFKEHIQFWYYLDNLLYQDIEELKLSLLEGDELQISLNILLLLNVMHSILKLQNC